MERWIEKTAVVTGASSGIGAAMVIDLVKAGLKVVALARRIGRLEDLKSKANYDNGGELHAMKCDVTVEQDIKDVFAWIDENLNGTHILVNNAAVLLDGKVIDKHNTNILRQTIDTNLMGVLLCTREAFQSMKANNIDDGHIVIINSTMGHSVPFFGPQFPCANSYASTKHGLTGLTEVLRQEFLFENTNIKISSISPGGVATEIFSADRSAIISPDVKLLKSEDVSNALLYILGTPPHVQVHDLIIKPIGEMCL